MDPDGDSLYYLNDYWREDLPAFADPQADEILIFGDYRPPPSELELLFDDVMSGILASTHPLFGPAVVESKRRLPRVGELLQMKPRQQRRAVRRRPYRDLVLANCLLDESTQFASKRPDEAEQCALLAEWIADQPWPDDPENAASIRITSLLSQAEVFRLQRNWKKAELRFAAAYALLRGRIAHHTHSTFCLRLYRLRADQGRYHEAELLLMWSMRIHCMLWDSDRLPSTDLCRIAVLALKQDDPGRAMAIVTRLYLEQENDPLFDMIRTDVDVIRAICMAAIGDAESVQTLMADARSRWRHILDRSESLRFEWLESRVAAHLGDLDHAIPRLEAIRRWLDSTKLDEICLISIDLAAAYAKQGQAAQRLPDLLADLAETRRAAEKPWALGSLWRFREELNRGNDPAVAAREAAEIVHRREMTLKGLSARRHPARAKGHSGRTRS